MKKGVILGTAVLFLCLLLGSFANAADVGYILINKRNPNKQVTEVFSSLNLTYDLIEDKNVQRYYNNGSMGNYRFLFIDDVRLNNARKIPIYNYPSVIMNKYYGLGWGLTDRDGISQMSSTSPLNVNLINDGRAEVYIQAKERLGGGFIPFYYLDDENKANLKSVARAFEGGGSDGPITPNEFGDVVAYANSGTNLINGKTSRGKICFFGIAKTAYWTNNAENLFKDCLGFVGSKCRNDSECLSFPKESKLFCSNNSVYKKVERLRCENPETVHSACVDGSYPELVENCDDDNIWTEDKCAQTINGAICEHKNITCFVDNDCDDNNNYTYDRCINPATINSTCAHTPITCLGNTDCGNNRITGNAFCAGNNLSNNYTTFLCNNPGQVNSFCSNSTEIRLNKTCADTCLDGSCRIIRCRNDSECDDNNVYTSDKCINPGMINSECNYNNIACFNNLECGTNVLSENACSGLNVVKRFVNFTCNNPGQVNSFCSNLSGNYNMQACAKQCSLGKCININCTEDIDCDDGNARTVDECAFAGTPSSYCRNTEVNCLNNVDCGFTGSSGNEYCYNDDIFKNFQTATCANPGTLNSACINSITSQFKSDCGSDYCSNFSGTYCKNGNVFYSKTCFDRGCALGSCFSTASEQELLSEECEHGCSLGKCLPQCQADNDCGNFSEAIYCSGSDLITTTTTPACMNGSCGLTVKNTTTLCPYGCSNGVCIGGVHDAALIDFANSVNKIRIKNETNSIVDNLICNKDYKFEITAENKGNFFENATFSGDIGGLSLNHNKIDNLAPGDSKLKSKTINLALAAGFYNITINALIPVDDNLLNNIARRQIEVTCAQPPVINCAQNSDCGIGTTAPIFFCKGDDKWVNSSSVMCFNPNTVNSYCGMNQTSSFVENCAFGCANGNCIIKCYNDSDCDDGNAGNIDKCVNAGKTNSYCAYEDIVKNFSTDCFNKFNSAMTNLGLYAYGLDGASIQNASYSNSTGNITLTIKTSVLSAGCFLNKIDDKHYVSWKINGKSIGKEECTQCLGSDRGGTLNLGNINPNVNVSEIWNYNKCICNDCDCGGVEKRIDYYKTIELPPGNYTITSTDETPKGDCGKVGRAAFSCTTKIVLGI